MEAEILQQWLSRGEKRTYGLDLVYLPERGIAFQLDPVPYPYDESYFQIYRERAGTPVEEKLNQARWDLVSRHWNQEDVILDVGIGNGSFLEKGLAEGKPVCGFDVNPVAQKWLDEREMGLNAFGYGMPATFGMITFWDTIEHVPNAREYLAACRDVVCISLPVFDQLEGVEKSKHYKPNEHLYYFTPWGLIGWMAAHGFRLLEYNRNETTAGRENIGAFAFQRIK